MEIKFGNKFSELQIDEFVKKIYLGYKSDPNESYSFDLTEIEWISNQSLLLLTGVIKYFISEKINFNIRFIDRDYPLESIPKRVAIQIVQIWEIWGLWKVIPNYEYQHYLGLNSGTINYLKELFKIDFKRPLIYDRFGITPFVCLNYIKNYDEKLIIQILKEYYQLNEATIEILNENNCEHPFVNGLLSEIISKELYENFLQHYGKTFFHSTEDFAFFSISLKGSLDTDYYGPLDIQEKLSSNFIEEELPESINFFYDQKTNLFRNRSYVTFSFLDFGQGIPSTLRDEFINRNPNDQDVTDEKIIKFAFQHDSSRNPIRNIFDGNKISDFIPRGLFDIICLVQRYKGLLIVRSCLGKVIFDFSKTSDFEKSFLKFGKEQSFFPGTFITILLPAISKDTRINNSVLKPIYEVPKYIDCKLQFTSISELIKRTKKEQIEDSYTFLFDGFSKLMHAREKTLSIISFDNIDNLQLQKKLIFFLISDYNINVQNNVVIINPPRKAFLLEINQEILTLSKTSLDYKIHPLPFIYNEKNEDISIFWLGIFDDQDRKLLDKLLLKSFSLSTINFNEPNKVVGHLNFYVS